MSVEGVVQLTGRGTGHLRRRAAGYLPTPGDPQIGERLIRQYGLRTGDQVVGELRTGKGAASLDRLLTLNGLAPAGAAERPEFDRLTAIHPREPLRLECEATRGRSSGEIGRVIDLVAPFGKGQRALVVAPAKAGKTTVLQAIAEAVSVNYPEAALYLLLVDERPEEIFEMEAAGFGEVVASSFDHPPTEHVALAELLLERARRQVELGRDVVLVVDSLTRLARAYNAVERGTGRTLSGGLDAQAMEKPKRFFGSARAVSPERGGGSLTIIATALVDTGSKMDQLIFEEFKGTGNSELVLSRELADRRVFPAIDIIASGTRKEELLLPPPALAAARTLRQRVARTTPLAAMNDLLATLRRHPSNAELVRAAAGVAPG